MNEMVGKFWTELCSRSETSELPLCPVAELCQALALTEAEVEATLGKLHSIGAVEFLSDEEINRMAAGERCAGRIIALANGDKWKFIRLFFASELTVRFAAKLALIREQRTQSESAPVIDVNAVIAEIGLTDQQLADGRSYPLDEHVWLGMRDKPAEYFPRVWQTHSALRRDKQMMDIIATLVRLPQYQMDRAAREVADREARELSLRHSINHLERLFAFASVVAASSAGERGILREPISEAVRHEVWRRDQGRCVKCGSQERLHFDHVIPVSKGGSSTARNLQILCETCNLQKGASI